jgi:hypothetical protein
MGILSSLSGIFGCSPKSAKLTGANDRTAVTAEFNHKIGPIDRGERYEDPLGDTLVKKGFGEVDGGGTMQSKEGEILFIDVHMFLSKPDESIPCVIQFLEERGAPKGSKLKIFDGEKVAREIPFGVREGFAIYLDGVNLPAEVYQESDSNVVVSEIDKRLKGHGEIESHWQGPTETALYIYGDSIVTMKPLIQDFMDSYPLCKGARVVDLTP